MKFREDTWMFVDRGAEISPKTQKCVVVFAFLGVCLANADGGAVREKLNFYIHVQNMMEKIKSVKIWSKEWNFEKIHECLLSLLQK